MHIMEFITQKNMTRYSLSKKSGVPWDTLMDICSGKTKLEHCDITTLSKLATVLESTIEDILLLEQTQQGPNGKPIDNSYLEIGLTNTLQEAIALLEQGKKEKISYLDCLYDNLYGSINADFWAGCITDEQAKYLRDKYL